MMGRDDSGRVAFACPPDCGHCCTHLEGGRPEDEEFRAILREQGIYACVDGTGGLALSNAEARTLRERANERGMKLKLHPRTFLVESRRRKVVVLDWHMPYASCPFYADYKCTIYADRPLVCRAYPVIGLPTSFAPACPKAPVPRAEVAAETRYRRAIERAHARLDETAWRILDAPDARFAKGLPAREASARARRYALVTPEEYVSSPPRTRSTT